MKKNGFWQAVRALAGTLIVIPIILALCAFAVPPQYTDTFLGEMREKQRLLRETPGRRIVIIGGSSVPFALNSSMLEETLPGWSVVDFGMYADLGTVVMLDWARAGIHEGDLVIIAPELDPQTLSCYVGGESVWQACDGDYASLLSLQPQRWSAVASSFAAFAGKKLRYTIIGAPEPEGVYRKSSFNDRGDIDCADRDQCVLPDLPVHRIKLSLPSEELVTELNRFADEMQKRGACVVYHYPPMNKAAIADDITADSVNLYHDALSDMLDFPILGDPHACLLDQGWFFDTNFHLNTSGAILFTKLLAEDIKVYLKDTTPTAIQLPDMPESVRTVVEGNHEDECLFIYRDTDNGWVITGLTGEGSLAEQLTVPAVHDERQVIGIDPSALSNAGLLRRLVVQENISALPDGLFSGCGMLQELVLKHTDPSACQVGAGLMSGASFTILVPTGSLDAYVRSYLWQQYEPWITSETE